MSPDSAPDHVTCHDLVAQGATYRQIDHWTSRGWLVAANSFPGSGNQRRYPLDQLDVVRKMIRLTTAGITPAAAYRAICNGGYLVTDVRVIIEDKPEIGV